MLNRTEIEARRQRVLEHLRTAGPGDTPSLARAMRVEREATRHDLLALEERGLVTSCVVTTKASPRGVTWWAVPGDEARLEHAVAQALASTKGAAFVRFAYPRNVGKGAARAS